MIAIAIAAHHEIACRATSRPSTTAIQSAKRTRRARSQRPARLVRWSITSPPSIVSTVPSGDGDQGAGATPERARGRPGPVAVLEEPIDGGPGPGHVRPKRAELPELVGQRRRGQIVQ